MYHHDVVREGTRWPVILQLISRCLANAIPWVELLVSQMR